MRQTYTLEAQERTRTGKGGARKVRAAGMCPAVLYGPDVESRSLQIDPKVFQKLLHAAGDNALIDLTVSGEGKEPQTLKVIIRDMDFSPIGEVPEHIDFYNVSLDRAIAVSVPIVLTGTCEAVENKSGTINQLVHELGIECLPAEIPEHIVIDISSLKLGHSLHVSDIAVTEGVVITESPEFPVISLSAVKEVEEEEAVAAEAESAEPQLVKPQKAAEEGA